MGADIVRHFRNHLHDFSRLSYVHGNPNQELQNLGFRPEDIIDCSLGTNPFGCSPRVLAALKEHAWLEIHRYPDPAYHDFVDALIRFWQPVFTLSRNSVIVGAGTSGLLEKTLKATIEPGRTVLGYSPQFTEFVTEVYAQGGSYDAVMLQRADNHAFDAEQFIEAMSSDYALIYIDNPNNPTGQIIPLNDIQRILERAKELSLLVLVDEAYGDFAAKEHSTLKLIPEFNNLITVRSFSKGSGLANLRVGYAVMHETLADYIRKVDLPFPLSTSAALAATVSLADEAYVKSCRRKISSSKRKLIDACPQFYYARTADEIPILVLGVADASVDLGRQLFQQAILTESGSDFYNLGQQYVRLRIPANIDELIRRLHSVSSL